MLSFAECRTCGTEKLRVGGVEKLIYPRSWLCPKCDKGIIYSIAIRYMKKLIERGDANNIKKCQKCG